MLSGKFLRSGCFPEREDLKCRGLLLGVVPPVRIVARISPTPWGLLLGVIPTVSVVVRIFPTP